MRLYGISRSTGHISIRLTIAGVMRVWVAISCLLRRLADRADADQRDHPNVINDHLRLPPTL
jgi:hypothetical protein